MKFLIDENLPRRLADQLRHAGHEAAHAHDLGPAGQPDVDAMAVARRAGSVIVTCDLDFSTLAALSGEALPSIVLFRDQQRRPEDLADMLIRNLAGIERSLSEGAIVVFDPARIRSRSLPLDEDDDEDEPS